MLRSGACYLLSKLATLPGSKGKTSTERPEREVGDKPGSHLDYNLTLEKLSVSGDIDHNRWNFFDDEFDEKQVIVHTDSDQVGIKIFAKGERASTSVSGYASPEMTREMAVALYQAAEEMEQSTDVAPKP